MEPPNGKRIRRLWSVVRDLAGLAGAGAIAYGGWLAWPPAGFIAGGLELLLGAILLARASEDA